MAQPAEAPATPGASASEGKVLAPSPLALEKEVRDAGLTAGLAGLVPTRTFATDVDDKDRVALRTGVVLSYTVLAGRVSPKPLFLDQLRSIRVGMTTLGTGKGLLATIDTFIQNIQNDTASREDFLQELDAVASSMIVEEGWGAGDRTGPLLQAGAWLAGPNLVAAAIVAADSPAAAEKLLRKAYVAEYFLGYLEGEGASKAGPTTSTVVETLRTLQSVANKPTLAVTDAQAVVAATETLLGTL